MYSDPGQDRHFHCSGPLSRLGPAQKAFSLLGSSPPLPGPNTKGSSSQGPWQLIPTPEGLEDGARRLARGKLQAEVVWVSICPGSQSSFVPNLAMVRLVFVAPTVLYPLTLLLRHSGTYEPSSASPDPLRLPKASETADHCSIPTNQLLCKTL